jgi:hypothetical protein
MGIEGYTFAKAIATVCKGHRTDDLLDYGVFDPKYYVVSGSDPVCLPFLAGCLMLADELDITRERTPDLLYRFVNPKNPISKVEWERHRSIMTIGQDGNGIKIQCRCENPVIHKSILRTAKILQDKIDIMQKVTRNLPIGLNGKYFITIEKVLEPKIDEVGYFYREFKFEFETRAVSNLLMGERIYSSKIEAIRELLQNAIDTCRLKSRLAIQDWSPIIEIGLSPDKKVLFIEDNGMGMDETIIEKFLLRKGNSYYNSFEFKSKNKSIFKTTGPFFVISDVFKIKSSTLKLFAKASKSKEPLFLFKRIFSSLSSSLVNCRSGTLTSTSLIPFCFKTRILK